MFKILKSFGFVIILISFIIYVVKVNFDFQGFFVCMMVWMMYFRVLFVVGNVVWGVLVMKLKDKFLYYILIVL